jgi:DNA-directed RNA polymerase specialized sigma24 family protein
MATAICTTASWTDSHLRAAEAAFADLTAAEPDPLTLDCDRLSAVSGVDLGLPAGAVPLATLRAWLMANPDSPLAVDAVWRELVTRARVDGGAWRLIAVGMAAPGMRGQARQLYRGFFGDQADMDNEVLTGFLAALDGRLDLAAPAPYAALLRAGYKAGWRLRHTNETAVPVEDIEAVAAGPRTPKRPYGHPDLLVRRARELGILAEADEEPFVDVRIAGRAIEPIAVRLGITVDCLRMRLNRAAERLATALAAGLLTGSAVPEAVKNLAAGKVSGLSAVLTKNSVQPPSPALTDVALVA